LILGSDDDRARFAQLLGTMPSYEQRGVLEGALKLLSKRFPPDVIPRKHSEWYQESAGMVSAVAGYLSFLIADDKIRKDYFISWLTSSSGAGLGDGVGIRRAVLAAMSKSKSDMETIFEKSLHQFGDQLYIRHAPMLQQEGETPVAPLSS
jgi:telomere length regulation protein